MPQSPIISLIPVLPSATTVQPLAIASSSEMLEFSRLEKGTRELSLVTGSPAPVLEEAAKLLRPHVEREGFTLHVEADGDLPPIRFDRDALLQVVFNLVDNALKYARHAERREVTLRCSRQGEGVAICVRDSGPGVLSRHLARVFEPFYRGERELTRRTKGTGLGLALVRALVEQMGGRVSGRNLDPVGFEVRVSFDPSPED